MTRFFLCDSCKPQVISVTHANCAVDTLTSNSLVWFTATCKCTIRQICTLSMISHVTSPSRSLVIQTCVESRVSQTSGEVVSMRVSGGGIFLKTQVCFGDPRTLLSLSFSLYPSLPRILWAWLQRDDNIQVLLFYRNIQGLMMGVRLVAMATAQFPSSVRPRGVSRVCWPLSSPLITARSRDVCSLDYSDFSGSRPLLPPAPRVLYGPLALGCSPRCCRSLHLKPL